MKIKVDSLYKSFKKEEIIKNINIEFKEGTIYGIIGKNGSGKSVFLKLLCGFYYPTSGSILYDDKELGKDIDFPQSTRALIEKPEFIPFLSGFDNLKLLAKINNKITDKEIIEAMKIVNIYADKDKKYSTYSLGTKQKLGLAQVIMENPRVMIFDEPLNGIEEETANEFRKFLKNIKKEHIIIIASHIKEDIDLLSDKVYRFSNGKLVQDEK